MRQTLQVFPLPGAGRARPLPLFHHPQSRTRGHPLPRLGPLRRLLPLHRGGGHQLPGGDPRPVGRGDRGPGGADRGGAQHRGRVQGREVQSERGQEDRVQDKVAALFADQGERFSIILGVGIYVQ